MWCVAPVTCLEIILVIIALIIIIANPVIRKLP